MTKVIRIFLVETAEAEATLRKFGCYATLRILSPSRFARHGPGFDYHLTDWYKKDRENKSPLCLLVETAVVETASENLLP